MKTKDATAFLAVGPVLFWVLALLVVCRGLRWGLDRILAVLEHGAAQTFNRFGQG